MFPKRRSVRGGRQSPISVLDAKREYFPGSSRGTKVTGLGNPKGLDFKAFLSIELSYTQCRVILCCHHKGKLVLLCHMLAVYQ